MWDSRILASFYDELEKIAEGPTKVVITSPGGSSASKRKGKEETLGDRAVRRLKGFAAGALPTAAGIKYLAPVKDLEKGVRGLHPGTHSKLQVAAGLGAGILGSAYASKDKKPSRVIVQL